MKFLYAKDSRPFGVFVLCCFVFYHDNTLKTLVYGLSLCGYELPFPRPLDFSEYVFSVPLPSTLWFKKISLVTMCT